MALELGVPVCDEDGVPVCDEVAVGVDVAVLVAELDALGDPVAVPVLVAVTDERAVATTLF